MSAPDQDEPAFELSISEVGIVYGLLFMQSIGAPSASQIMDIVERKEILVGMRDGIPDSLEAKESLRLDMREYLVELFGEDKVSVIEAQLRSLMEDGFMPLSGEDA